MLMTTHSASLLVPWSSLTRHVPISRTTSSPVPNPCGHPSSVAPLPASPGFRRDPPSYITLAAPAPTASGPAGLQISSQDCPRTVSRGGAAGSAAAVAQVLGARCRPADAAAAAVSSAVEVAEACRFRFPSPRDAGTDHWLLTALKPPTREGSAVTAVANGAADAVPDAARMPLPGSWSPCPRTRWASSRALGPLVGAAEACWSMNAWA